MKKYLIIGLVIVIGIAIFLFFSNSKDETLMKSNEKAVREFVLTNENVTESDIIRIETSYNPDETSDKFKYMVEVELKIEPDVIRMYTVDKSNVHLFGKVQKE